MFLTLIHMGGGSTFEAADADVVLGPFDSLKEAESAGSEFFDIVVAVDELSWVEDDLFWTTVELPSGVVTPQMGAEAFIKDNE